MKKLLVVLLSVLLFSCDQVTYYIVRHAEKDTTTMTGDPALTAEGEKRALDLMYMLQGSKIRHIYSTNYMRTLATAEPTRKHFGLDVQLYDPKNNAAFVDSLKAIKSGDVLVIGHSNTVDDIVNGLLGENKMIDLSDSVYGMVYKVTRSGNSYSLETIPIPKSAAR